MIITKEWLQEQQACSSGIKWFLNQDKTDSIEVLDALINQDNLPDANWLIVRLMDRQQKIRYAIFAAEQVLHIFENKYPENKRPGLAIEAAKKVLENDTEENRNAAAAAAAAAAAYAAAAAAAAAAYAAAAAAADAAYTAAAAADAAYAAAYADARKEMRIRILNYGKELLCKI
jgi:hypothetical protein